MRTLSGIQLNFQEWMICSKLCPSIFCWIKPQNDATDSVSFYTDWLDFGVVPRKSINDKHYSDSPSGQVNTFQKDKTEETHWFTKATMNWPNGHIITNMEKCCGGTVMTIELLAEQLEVSRVKTNKY